MNPAPWYTSPEWWLTIVGALAAIVGALTLVAIYVQSIAMKKSVRLQEANLRQWLNVENLVHEPVPEIPELKVSISFRIRNPTKQPLKLQWYIFTLNGTKHNSKPNLDLAPDQSYLFKTILEVRGAALEHWKEGRFTVTITGTVGFKDLFEKERKQTFGKRYVCGAYEGKALPYEGVVPEEEI